MVVQPAQQHPIADGPRRRKEAGGPLPAARRVRGGQRSPGRAFHPLWSFQGARRAGVHQPAKADQGSSHRHDRDQRGRAHELDINGDVNRRASSPYQELRSPRIGQGGTYGHARHGA